MGGERCEVHDGTTRVLMEVATWNGPGINHTSWKLGLRSEASARFEKGLPPEGCLEAQAVATALMLELTGATLVPGTLDVGGPARPSRVRLRDARVSGLLGADVPRERSAEILSALGFTVTEADDGLDVGVPHWRRGDVTREADLIEEVARIDALERAARDDPGEPHRPARPADPRAAAAPPGRGRARRPRPARGRRLVVHRPRAARPAARAAGRPPARPRRAREPDVRRAVGAAADDLSARCSTSRATTAPAARSDSRSSSPAPSTGRGDGPLPTSITRSARCSSAPRGRASWREAAAARGRLRGAGARRGGARRAARRLARRAGERVLPASRAARGVILAGDAVLGIFGEVHPTVLATWEFDAPAAFSRSTSARPSPPRPTRRPTPT